MFDYLGAIQWRVVSTSGTPYGFLATMTDHRPWQVLHPHVASRHQCHCSLFRITNLVVDSFLLLLAGLFHALCSPIFLADFAKSHFLSVWYVLGKAFAAYHIRPDETTLVYILVSFIRLINAVLL